MWQTLITPKFERQFKKLETQKCSLIVKTYQKLRVDPLHYSGAKSLVGCKGEYRIGAGDHRIVYKLNKEDHSIILLRVKHRKDVYKGKTSQKMDGKSVETLLRHSSDAPSKSESLPMHDASMDTSETMLVSEHSSIISSDVLDYLLDVPAKYHESILKLTHLSELECLHLPSEIEMQVVDYLTNPDETDIGRLYSLDQDQTLESIIQKPLSEFLLKLDKEQQRIVDLPIDKGPYLIRGGPGTGKTLIGIYRLIDILKSRSSESLFDKSQAQFLFLSYTNSLVNTSRAMFDSLAKEKDIQVEFSTLDKIVVRSLKRYYERGRLKLGDPLSGDTLKFVINKFVFKKMRGDAASTAKVKAVEHIESRFSIDFLIEEITDVIEANDLTTFDSYASFKRTGKRQLHEAGRIAMWEACESFKEWCDENNRYTWAGRRQIFLHLLEGGKMPSQNYNYIVIDEAQDMSLVGLRIAIRISSNPRFLAILTDTGQSIYNKAPTWKNIDPHLRFHKGNSIALARSYRMTKQLCLALEPVRVDAEIDKDALGCISGVFSGDLPIRIDAPLNDHGSIVSEIIFDLIEKKKMNGGRIAVVCRSKNAIGNIKAALDEEGVQSYRYDKDSPLSLEGQKVHLITAHNAKGLEFPSVIVPFFSDSEYPSTKYLPAGTDNDLTNEWLEKEQRLLYVALSRASHKLWLLSDSENPSRYLRLLKEEDWDIQSYE